MRFSVLGLVAFICALACPGCGGTNPNTGPAVAINVADYAYKALHSVNIISQTAKDLEAAHAPGVTVENAGKVVQLSLKANQEGKKLADLLDVYAAATDPAKKFSQLAQITASLQTFSDVVGEIGKIDLASATAQIKSLIDAVKTDIDTIKQGLAAQPSSQMLGPVSQVASLQTPSLRTHSVLAN